MKLFKDVLLSSLCVVISFSCVQKKNDSSAALTTENVFQPESKNQLKFELKKIKISLDKKTSQLVTLKFKEQVAQQLEDIVENSSSSIQVFDTIQSLIAASKSASSPEQAAMEASESFKVKKISALLYQNMVDFAESLMSPVPIHSQYANDFANQFALQFSNN